MIERSTYQQRAELLMRHRSLGYLSEREKSELLRETGRDGGKEKGEKDAVQTE